MCMSDAFRLMYCDHSLTLKNRQTSWIISQRWANQDTIPYLRTSSWVNAPHERRRSTKQAAMHPSTFRMRVSLFLVVTWWGTQDESFIDDGYIVSEIAPSRLAQPTTHNYALQKVVTPRAANMAANEMPRSEPSCPTTTFPVWTFRQASDDRISIRTLPRRTRLPDPHSQRTTA